MSGKEKLLSFVSSISELSQYANYLKSPVRTTYTECLSVLTSPNVINKNILFKINSLLDYIYEQINTGHWSNVSLNIRQVFTICSFLKSFIILSLSENTYENALRESLQCTDLGILLGAPSQHSSIVSLNNLASYLTEELNKFEHSDLNNVNSTEVQECTRKRRKSVYTEYEDIQATEISTVKCPAIDNFFRNHFQPQIPVKLTDCISHWPAMKKWSDVNYLLKMAGNRTVPVEIGSHYVDENWSQKLMTLKDFITIHFLGKSSSLGYLAQHNLFDQISELRKDIYIPEYCCLSNSDDNSSDPDINAWFGPEGTVSPLHFDPKDNLLAQVFGVKQVILFSPDDSKYLYPHEDKLLFNTSQVNPLSPDLEKYPKFKAARMYKCLLEAGEMLFIPEKWWHHINALDKSFSVSFWWK